MTTSLTIDSTAAPGESIRLREATAVGRPGHAGRAVLFVHGATYPGVMFDVPGASWLARAVADGYDAYALDVRGYGGSYRPEAMDAPADTGEPFCRATDAVADIADAVAEIRRRAGVARVHLVGWSWGTMTSGRYAAGRPGTIERLVLFAPVYASANPQWQAALAEPGQPRCRRRLGAYRTETAGQAEARWLAQITAARPDAWRDPAIHDAWFAAMLSDEPGQAVRAPNGVMLDLWEAFSGRPVYDAGAIRVPTLVIRGSADTTATRTDGLALFGALAGAPHRQYVEIADASHFALLEHRRAALHAQVQAFLAAGLAE
ncbi:alpha/beta fold hydrolase [Salinisphaera sp. Q1T1-3]|uniref:alpha/beta fold hydrolase n=1 Tax=Salinisphaera sp. Q1T1-3 TaxID=2321229 RepID=UPI000E717DEA|nr:alpha/beta hydrolase [Salinisphaera sp. Q1T1-3]RJS91162.1 alpha/beta hydrolase [Salinisphaera sp. Q1T1-3]